MLSNRSRQFEPFRNCQQQALLLAGLLLLVIILCILVISLVSALWLQGAPQGVIATLVNRPTATSILPPTFPPNTDTWTIIRSRGKISVGVSADYPPFAYIAPDFTLQGYDIALAQEIGRRLNMPVEIINMAFDGLFPALQLHQIDMAISAISSTPERAALVDFSNIYYMSEDAVIARADAPIEIRQEADLGKYRVGVQRGSVYETWLQNRLVLPGLMPPPYLVTFETAEAAVNSLAGSAPGVDLVVMDNLPATTVIVGKPLKIITRGLNPQGYAVALPKNSPTFQGLLNVVIAMMESDGTLTRLAREHLKIVEPAPLVTPTPAPPLPPPVVVPTLAPTPIPAACLDAMGFVADLNYPDNNMTTPAIFSAGQTFQKSWRIRNLGSCTWDNRYSLVYVGANPAGSPVGGNPVAISGTVPPGGTYDVSATITAPLQAGRYQSFWSMRSPSGATFGSRLWAGMDVVTSPGPTVGPTSVVPGPVITVFTATPQQIQSGQCVNLTWAYNTLGGARARLFRGAGLILQDMPASGSYIDCPTENGQVEYRLLVDTQGGGSSTASQGVIVQSGPLPPITQTPVQQPLIQSFTGSAGEVVWGRCVTLSWVYVGGVNITAAELYRNDERIAQGLNPSGSIEDCPLTWGLFTYRLQISSATAGSSSATFYVNVRPLSALSWQGEMR